jgi:hypothetical protein
MLLVLEFVSHYGLTYFNVVFIVFHIKKIIIKLMFF